MRNGGGGEQGLAAGVFKRRELLVCSYTSALSVPFKLILFSHLRINELCREERGLANNDAG